MSDGNDLPQRDRWARLRFAIIGPLLAAPPVTGELHEALNALAGVVLALQVAHAIDYLTGDIDAMQNVEETAHAI